MTELAINEKLQNVLKNFDYRPQYQVTVMDKKIDIPVVYADTSAVMAFFPISMAKAVALLKTKRLKPVSILRGKCVLGITIFDYHDCPVGPYREIALSIPVTLDSIISIPLLPLVFDSFFSTFGFYTMLLAMSTDIARMHSEQIFGYPTFPRNVEINMATDDTDITIEAKEGDKKIIALTMKKPITGKPIKKKYLTYFVKNDIIMSVEMQTVAFEARSQRNDQVLLEIGNHEISQILNMLAVEPRALQSVYYASAIEILNSPKKMGVL